MLDAKLQSEEYKFYFLFFLALTFFFSMLMPISYIDFGVWIAEGRQIIQQSTVYIHDAYSFNPTEAHPFPWLSSLFYYLLDNYFSIECIFILHRLIPVAIVAFWLTRYPALLEKKNIIALMISICGLRILIVDRPALLALPFIPLFYELIETEDIYKNKTRNLLLLTLWTNLHGSFVLFFPLLGYKLFTRLIVNFQSTVTREKLLFVILSILATFVNPWGFKIYNYVLETVLVSRTRILEWQSLSLFKNGEISYQFIFFALSSAILLGLVLYKKKFIEFLSSLMPVFLISAAVAIRNLPLLFTVFPLFWGRHLVCLEDVSGYTKKVSYKKIYFNRAIIAFLVIPGFFIFTNFGDRVRQILLPAYAPKYDDTSSFRIASYLNQKTGKRIFNSWDLGSFLSYSQTNQIFIDTRSIIYGNNIFLDYQSVVQNQNHSSETLLKQYQIDYVVTSKNMALNQVLQTSQNWTFIMEDNGYLLFERK